MARSAEEQLLLTPLKTCRDCAQQYPESEFAEFMLRTTTKTYGPYRTSYCSRCRALRSAENLARHRDTRRAQAKAKWTARREKLTRACRTCRVTQPRTEFAGPSPYCQSCCARVGLRRDQLLTRRFTLKRYGLTPETYQAMLDQQHGVCAICGGLSPTRPLDVDHDHATGMVRGLLCIKCNRGLGNLGDDPDILVRAIEYLTIERYNAPIVDCARLRG